MTVVSVLAGLLAGGFLVALILTLASMAIRPVRATEAPEAIPTPAERAVDWTTHPRRDDGHEVTR